MERMSAVRPGVVRAALVCPVVADQVAEGLVARQPYDDRPAGVGGAANQRRRAPLGSLDPEWRRVLHALLDAKAVLRAVSTTMSTIH